MNRTSVTIMPRYRLNMSASFSDKDQIARYFCVILYSAAFIMEAVNGLQTQHYRQEVAFTGQSPTNFVQLESSARGVSECAGLCQRSTGCWSFFYSKTENKCFLSKNLVYRIQYTTAVAGYRHHVTRSTTFSGLITKGMISNPDVNDVSGVAASRLHDVIYVINDKGGGDGVYALNVETGNVVAVLTVDGNGDREDLAVGSCGTPGTSCVYICDYGADSSDREIYKFEEPTSLYSQNIAAQKLDIQWAGADNVETLMIDPEGNAYMLTTGSGAQVALVPAYAWGSPSFTVQQGTPVSFEPVGGDISPFGGEILIKTMDTVFLFQLNPTESNLDALISSTYTTVPHTQVNKGTSIGWSTNGDGFYIMDEEDLQNIHYYQREKLL